MTTYYLTVNGREYGVLTPREQEILDAGEWIVRADLHAKVQALPQPKVAGVLYAIDDVVSRADVLALLDGSSG